MKKIIVATSVLASSLAFAGDYKINLDGRYDFVSAANLKSAVATTAGVNEKYDTFSNGTIRLNMFSQVNDNLSLRFRFRFQKGAVSSLSASNTQLTTGREDLQTQLDYFYADYKNTYFTTRFGKQNWLEAVGRESFISATDLFASSAVYSNYKTAWGSDYRGGVSFIYKYADGTFTFALSNPNAPTTSASANAQTGDTAGATLSNKGLAWGVNYNGSFVNKLVQPVLSYQAATISSENEPAAVTSGTITGTNKLWAAGLRSEVSGFTIDLDYKQLVLANRNASGGTAAYGNTTDSAVLNVAYSVAEFTPFLTYISDRYTSDKAATGYKAKTVQVGAFWKPFADQNFRYHLLYATSDKNGDDVNFARIKDTRVTLGIKADI